MQSTGSQCARFTWTPARACTNIQAMFGKEMSTTFTFDYPSSTSWYCKPGVDASQVYLLRPNE